MKLSIIIPCFNEEANIPTLVARLREAIEREPDLSAPSAYEILLIDDGSADGTWAAIEAEQANNPPVRGVRHEQNQGIAEAWATGAREANGLFLLTMDADLQYRPADVPLLYKEVIEGVADLVQGHRVEQVAPGPFRTALSVVLSGLLNAIFGLGLKDAKSGFVCYRSEAFRDILADRRAFHCFQHFITVAAAARNYRIRQVPVVFDSRHAGQSFITNPLAFSLRALVDLPRALLYYRFKRPVPRMAPIETR